MGARLLPLNRGVVVQQTIIVVEDDDALRYAYDRTLKAAGYVVHPFPDYRGVFELLDDGVVVDLLLVDLVLAPGTPHGLSLAAMARRRRTGLPALYVTGYPDYAEHVATGSTVLLKPVKEGLLLAAIAGMMVKQ